jgi:hypothetical protein
MTPPPPSPKHAALTFSLSHTSSTPPLLSQCLYSIIVHARSECLLIVSVQPTSYLLAGHRSRLGFRHGVIWSWNLVSAGLMRDDWRVADPQDEDKGSGVQGETDE